MNRFADIKEKLLRLAEKEEGLRAVIAIGSDAREFAKADEYSDLDLVLVCEEPDGWIYGDLPCRLGEVMISFTEPTFAGAMERRVLYSGNLDVDMIVLTPEQLCLAAEQGIIAQIFSRGYSVLYDAGGYAAMAEQWVRGVQGQMPMAEGDFQNTVQDFWFHTVWLAKKIARGELWTAKMCVDGYLKTLLLRILEQSRCGAKDVWHNGRFLEQWAQPETVAALGGCFARYDRAELMPALLQTAELFASLAHGVATERGFSYPWSAEDYARALLKEYAGREHS